jgi:hypothetical protein
MDGSLMGKIKHEYTDIPGGIRARHVITFPKACKEVIDGHVRHMAVEFLNWMLGGVKDLKL